MFVPNPSSPVHGPFAPGHLPRNQESDEVPDEVPSCGYRAAPLTMSFTELFIPYSLTP